MDFLKKNIDGESQITNNTSQQPLNDYKYKTRTLKLIDVARHMPPIVMATDKLPFNNAFLTCTLNNNILVVAKKVMHSKKYPIIENVKKLINDSNGSSAV